MEHKWLRLNPDEAPTFSEGEQVILAVQGPTRLEATIAQITETGVGTDYTGKLLDAHVDHIGTEVHFTAYHAVKPL